MEKWQIYLGEAETQVKFALRSFEHFEQARNSRDSEAIFYHLHHFIVHIVNVDKVLSPKAGSSRAQLLDGRINLNGIDLKQIRAMRNHLEHYDERLDRWIAEFYGGPFFDMNITTGSKGFPYHAALRALDGNDLRFMSERYDVSALRIQLLQLKQRLTRGLTHKLVHHCSPVGPSLDWRFCVAPSTDCSDVCISCHIVMRVLRMVFLW